MNRYHTVPLRSSRTDPHRHLLLCGGLLAGLLGVVPLPANASNEAGEESCCPPGCEQLPTKTISTPKGSTTYGVMGDVGIGLVGVGDVTGLTKFFAWAANLTLTYTAGGGGDSDVCWKSEGPCLSTYGVGTNWTWSGGAPGGSPPNNPTTYIVSGLEKPEEGAVDSYTLTATADDTGECNVGDESKAASTTLKVYWPYKKGPQPTGVVQGKPVPRVFNYASPTFGWNDQLLNKSAGVFRSFSATVHDYDDTESNLLSAGPTEQVLWDDPKADDVPGPNDVTWAGGGSTAVGNPANLEIPIGGTTSAVIWDVAIASLDDEALPELADDPPATNVDAVTWQVFRDQLARDIANEGDLKGPPKANPGNCFGGAQHAYNGSTTPVTPPWGGGGPSPVVVFAAPKDPAQGVWINDVNTYPFARGGVVVYNGGTHIQTCKGGGTGVWEYNGRCANPSNWGDSDIKFTRGLLIDPTNPTNCSPSAMDPTVERFTTLIEYYPPPANY